MSKNKEFHFTWEWIFSHVNKIESVLRSSIAQEKMYNLALLNNEQDIVHKMDFTDIIDFIHSCKNQEKTVLSVLF